MEWRVQVSDDLLQSFIWHFGVLLIIIGILVLIIDLKYI